MSMVPLNLKLEEGLLNQVDWYAVRAGVNRTTFITNLLKAMVDGHVVVHVPKDVPLMRERFYRVPARDVDDAISALNKVFGPKPDHGCWTRSNADLTQYQGIRIGDTTYRAHRLSYMLFRQPIPYGWVVCHLCDTPGCISPDHLRLGTSDDNSRDRARKNRTPAHLQPKDSKDWDWPPPDSGFSPVVGPDPFPAETAKRMHRVVSYPVNSYGERDVLAQMKLERSAFPDQYKGK
jgi:hypothetical protein